MTKSNGRVIPLTSILRKIKTIEEAYDPLPLTSDLIWLYLIRVKENYRDNTNGKICS